MAKRLYFFVLLAAIVSFNAGIAQAQTEIEKTDGSSLKEIVLDVNSVQDEVEKDMGNVSIAGAASEITNQEKAVDLKDENGSDEKCTNPLCLKHRLHDSDNRFLNVLYLKGAVEKALPEKEHTAVEDWLNGSYATGKWFGARPILEDHGLSVNSSLLYSPFIKTGGGSMGEGSGKGYSLFNLSVTLDTEKAGLWKGGTFFALYQKKTGYGLAGPTGGMGDWMYFDGWEARQVNQISECWYQQKLFDNKVRLKFGKQDANVDFGFLNTGWDFMNLAFSVNPTVPMPTYPDQATVGFVAEYNPTEWLSLRNGTYSKYNVPFNISEVEVKTKIKSKPGRYSIGAWEMSDSSGMSVAGGIDNSGEVYYNNFNRNFGVYAQFEQMVYKENKDDDNDMQGLIAFGQFGMSPSNRNDMNRYVGGGFEYVGPIPKRDKDKIGIAVGNGTFAQRLGDITSQVGDETAIEAFYRIQLTPWFYLQPDVQFLMNPSGTYANSVAVGLRSVITF